MGQHPRNHPRSKPAPKAIPGENQIDPKSPLPMPPAKPNPPANQARSGSAAKFTFAQRQRQKIWIPFAVPQNESIPDYLPNLLEVAAPEAARLAKFTGQPTRSRRAPSGARAGHGWPAGTGLPVPGAQQNLFLRSDRGKGQDVLCHPIKIERTSSCEPVRPSALAGPPITPTV